VNQRATLPSGVIASLALAVLLNYIDRGNLATAAPLVQDELKLTSGQIGLLLSAFFWTYAPGQLLAGWAVHRFSIRLVLGAGVALWAVATFLTGWAGSFTTLLLLRLLLGLGESAGFPSVQLLLARHTPEHRRGMLMGLITMCQGIGPMLGTLFGAMLIAQFGWRSLFFALGLITLLWLVPWLVTMRAGQVPAYVEEAGSQVSYAAILRRREFWGVALGHFSCNYVFYFMMTWLPTFLVKSAGFTVTRMGQIGAVIFAIYALSVVSMGTLSDVWVRHGASLTRVRKTLVLTSNFGAALTIACCALVEPRSAVWFLGLAGVFFGMGTPMIFAIGATLAGPRAAGRWVGAQNLSGQLAGIIAPLVTGFIVESTGGFGWAFVISAAVPLVGMIAWGIVLRRIEPLEWRGVSMDRVAPAV